MQDKFLLKTKQAIKRVVAIGIGGAMFGLSASGALAQAESLDLGSYPSPFVVGGEYDSSNALVVGENAAASDTLGMVDIAANLQFEAKDCSPSGDGTVTISGGESEDIPIGSNIAATNQLDRELDDSDLDGFVDTTVNFKSADYDVSDTLIFGRLNNVSAASSLTASDDDYESNVVVEVERDAIKYYYKFDETINLNGTSSSDPLEIKFLGKTIKITKTDSATKFTAQIGTEYFMDIDDVVTVIGKKITLQNVGSGGAVVVDVDGVQETISSGSTRTVNGIEITNDESFYTDTRDERSATLVIGQDATQSYVDSDEYIGEDDNDPKWVWDIGNLTSSTTTTIGGGVDGSIMVGGISLGIENDWRWVDGADGDALSVGDCLDLPNNYVSLCFDSTTVADDNYLDLDISLEKRVDFTDSVSGYTSRDSVRIKSSVKESLKLKDGVLQAVDNLTKDVKTDEVWIIKDNALGNFSVFYKDQETNKKYFAGNGSLTSNNFIEIDFKDTKSTNVAFDLNLNEGAIGMNLTLDIQGDTDSDLPGAIDDIVTLWRNDSTTNSLLTSLGSTASSEEAGELIWYGAALTTIGTKDEDHRTRYGIVIKDPKSNGASDEVKVSIPGDQVQANVVVRGPSTLGGSSAGEVCTVADINPRTLLDTEVTNPENYNLIVVGGPAINSVARTFIGTAEEFRTTYSPGEAIIRLVDNGNKVAMVVAGYDAMDTRRAAKVLANHEDYTLTGSEALVKGTSLTDITVE